MVTSDNDANQAVPPSLQDSKLARDSSKSLTRLLASKRSKPIQFRISRDGKSDEIIALPVAALRILSQIVEEMAKGNAVKVIPVTMELSTQQAAEILNVSRPFLVEQLEKGTIPYRKVGTHRRVMFKDVMNYKGSIDRNRLKALEALSEQAQELKMGY